jgi:TRAP-type mannitol/chloroaromatic compound transport system permease small subunit
MLLKLLDIIDTINEWLGKIVSYVLLLLMITVTYDIFMRFFFNRPTSWAMEVSQFSLLTITCFGVGYVFLHRGHIVVDIIFNRFPSRARAAISLFTASIVLFVSIVLIRYGGKSAWAGFIGGYKTESAWHPTLWPFMAMVPISGLLLGFQCLAKWIRDLVMVMKGKELESRVLSAGSGLKE